VTDGLVNISWNEKDLDEEPKSDFIRNMETLFQPHGSPYFPSSGFDPSYSRVKRKKEEEGIIETKEESDTSMEEQEEQQQQQDDDNMMVIEDDSDLVDQLWRHQRHLILGQAFDMMKKEMVREFEDDIIQEAREILKDELEIEVQKLVEVCPLIPKRQETSKVLEPQNLPGCTVLSLRQATIYSEKAFILTVLSETGVLLHYDYKTKFWNGWMDMIKHAILKYEPDAICVNLMGKYSSIQLFRQIKDLLASDEFQEELRKKKAQYEDERDNRLRDPSLVSGGGRGGGMGSDYDEEEEDMGSDMGRGRKSKDIDIYSDGSLQFSDDASSIGNQSNISKRSQLFSGKGSSSNEEEEEGGGEEERKENEQLLQEINAQQETPQETLSIEQASLGGAQYDPHLHLVDDKLALNFAQSKRGQMEFTHQDIDCVLHPDNPPDNDLLIDIRACIATGRYYQNPLAEYCFAFLNIHWENMRAGFGRSLVNQNIIDLQVNIF